jgi:hypothetical protein
VNWWVLWYWDAQTRKMRWNSGFLGWSSISYAVALILFEECHNIREIFWSIFQWEVDRWF